jgi:hypothetical protein
VRHGHRPNDRGHRRLKEGGRIRRRKETCEQEVGISTTETVKTRE